MKGRYSIFVAVPPKFCLTVIKQDLDWLQLEQCQHSSTSLWIMTQFGACQPSWVQSPVRLPQLWNLMNRPWCLHSCSTWLRSSRCPMTHQTSARSLVMLWNRLPCWRFCPSLNSSHTMDVADQVPWSEQATLALPQKPSARSLWFLWEDYDLANFTKSVRSIQICCSERWFRTASLFDCP